eukprot:TRINITY_DN880_c0_g3_i1.p1 TRINITY_DN880_c0_g3~~TRINITY_DN880_c0_g3_i1.p1  ORF type:complete len:249 (+),score=64.13 TRINITY_DN880_c0_g3_i1:97-843(+)
MSLNCPSSIRAVALFYTSSTNDNDILLTNSPFDEKNEVQALVINGDDVTEEIGVLCPENDLLTAIELTLHAPTEIPLQFASENGDLYYRRLFKPEFNDILFEVEMQDESQLKAQKNVKHEEDFDALAGKLWIALQVAMEFDDLAAVDAFLVYAEEFLMEKEGVSQWNDWESRNLIEFLQCLLQRFEDGLATTDVDIMMKTDEEVNQRNEMIMRVAAEGDVRGSSQLQLRVGGSPLSKGSFSLQLLDVP